VNTDALAKLYDRLKPAERLPLLIAARRRGDELERQRLAQAAPRTAYQVPDHFALAMALQEAVTFHLVELLERAGKFWQAWGLWGWCQHRSRPKESEKEARMLGLVRLHAYYLTIHVDAWRRFSEELQIEPEALLDFMPGYDMIRRTRDVVRDLAYTFEEATICLRLHGKEVEMPPTVEDVLVSLRGLLKAREVWWDEGKG
jgi:hypothetical protein